MDNKNEILIPEGESCSNEKGICPFWEAVVFDNDDVIRAKCNFLDFEETTDYQCTFLWGMLKICNLKNEME